MYNDASVCVCRNSEVLTKVRKEVVSCSVHLCIGVIASIICGEAVTGMERKLYVFMEAGV